MGTPNRFAQALRDTMIPMVSRLAPFQHAFVQRLSELGIAYRGSPIVEGAGKRYLDDSLRGGEGIRSRFLLFCGREVNAEVNEDARQLAESLHDVVELRAGSQKDLTLVRPDGYIAYWPQPRRRRLASCPFASGTPDAFGRGVPRRDRFRSANESESSWRSRLKCAGSPPPSHLVPALLALAALNFLAGAPAMKWEVQTTGVTARLRGVSAVSQRVAWASGANGTVLRTVDGGQTWQKLTVPGAEKLDFRDVDATERSLGLRVEHRSRRGIPDLQDRRRRRHWDLQLANTDPKVFLDAMTFRDDRHGVAFSDSVDGRFVIFTTSNGRTWEQVHFDRLPPALPGEGAYAASGTNIAMARGGIWIGTTAGRVLRSIYDGRTWTVSKTGLATSQSAGIFSVAFRDTKHGVVVGGDYLKESAAGENAAWTSDGGVTWSVVKDHGLSGLRSVAAFVDTPSGGEAGLIAIGPTGADWSDDDGRTWSAIEAAGFDTFSVSRDGSAGWASGAGGRISRWSAR